MLIRDCDWQDWEGADPNQETGGPGKVKDMDIAKFQFLHYYEAIDDEGKVKNKWLRPAAEWPVGKEPFKQVVDVLKKLIAKTE